MSETLPAGYWREHGVKIVPGSALDLNTPQTPGMTRAAAITHARTGANKLWAGTVTIHANAKTGAHHHGELESVIFVVSGRARMRWGDALEFTAEAGPGDFIYVPPFVPHQEINASRDEQLHCVLVRSGQDPVVVNLDIAPAEPPEDVRGWIRFIRRRTRRESREAVAYGFTRATMALRSAMKALRAARRASASGTRRIDEGCTVTLATGAHGDSIGLARSRMTRTDDP